VLPADGQKGVKNMSMYNYIFAAIYQWAIHKGKGQWLSKQHACNGVTFALLTHISLILEILKIVLGNEFVNLSLLKKTVLIGGIIFLFAAVRLFYTKIRIQNIQNKYLANNKVSKGSGWLVFSIIFIPLIVLIFVGWQRG
jgi:hypothetical protein